MPENFVHFLETNARRFGEKPALVWETGSLTWSELDRRASGFALNLARQSVGPGDRVAILLPNGWSFAVALLGIFKRGATAAPLSPALTGVELDALLADLRPKQVVDDVPVEDGPQAPAAEGSFPALVIYTSGSTGAPKGAVFSHSALLAANRIWAEVVMGLTPADVVLGVLPCSHNYGLYAGLLAPLLCGATVVPLERFSPEATARAIKRHGVTIFPGVATMFRRMLNSSDVSPEDLSSLRLAVSGAAPCASELCAEWRGRIRIRIVCGYGATEVPRTISYCADDENEVPGATGKLMPGVEMRVVDEHGMALPEGEVGELLIKSPTAMEGYLDDPEETRAVLNDGWFRSGDVGAVLPGGYVRLVGRKRDRILRGGYSVFPQEIEGVLCSHAAVAEAAAVGVPDPDVGEEVVAVVAFKPGAEAPTEELIARCRKQLAAYKCPRRVVIVKELPRGPTGKVLYSELLKIAAGAQSGGSVEGAGTSP
ncbi:MAG TPA: AMP-binding protein [candidate division Zixibacteria bacterium]|nr:AMP-binding protein [candidate division Zixibacteria bacterium]